MRPIKPITTTSRSSRIFFSRTFSKAILTYTTPLLTLLVTALITAVYYFAIQAHNVELSFDQLSAFERQVSTVGNNSLYIVEPPRHDDILTSLSKHDWAKLSSRIDYVIFVYDDMYASVDASWLHHVSDSFGAMSPKGYGLILFSCGCIIPNIVFAATQTRFDGFECTMLPGFVIASQSVAFIDIHLPNARCNNRDAILESPWYETNAWKLDNARREHEQLTTSLLNST